MKSVVSWERESIGQQSSNEEVGFPLQIGSAFEVKGGGDETETVFPDLYNALWEIKIYSKGTKNSTLCQRCVT